MNNLIAFMVGLLFAIGLCISGMTQPHLVKGFLDVFGEWKWNLLGVMGGAVVVHAILYQLIMKRKRPIYDTEFHVPKSQILDKRLIGGAVIFGLGWGWAGICPGPGLTALASGQKEFIAFVVCMLIGMKGFQIVDAKFLSK